MGFLPESMFLDPIYNKTFAQIMILILVLFLAVFPVRNSYSYTKLLWASLRTWVFLTPILFVLFSFKNQLFLLALLCLFSLYACRRFFQMVGVYHRHVFVLSTYAFTGFLLWAIRRESYEYYDLAPMLFLGCISLIPLIKNNFQNMIQYISLCLFAFIFFSWAPLHLGRIIYFEDGFLLCVFAIIISEVAETSCLITSEVFKRGVIFSGVSEKVTLSGVLVAILASSLMAWILTPLLPFRLQSFAFSISFAIVVLSLLGDLIITVIRKDLKITDTGVFIFGKGDIIDRMDKLIFLAPFIYYIYEFPISI